MTFDIKKITEETKDLSWKEKIQYISNYKNVTFSTSFSIEDQIILEYISRKKLNIEVFTLDTGRLFEETYKIWKETVEKYNIEIRPYYPNNLEIESFVNKNGINSFYSSQEKRISCCNIRKVNPLKRALKDKNIWISGVRKEHSNSRQEKDFFETDNNFNIIKFYPLLKLTEDELWDIIKNENIIYNELYNKGFKSIGCSPCTRAVAKDEDIRSGRWWWEKGKKECGLHLVNGKLVRPLS